MELLEDERPPSLLSVKRIEPKFVAAGVSIALGAHLVIPLVLVASQWLLVLLGLAVEDASQKPLPPPQTVVAAEFVKLGKPFDPRKLPNRKVPPIVKRKSDAVKVSADARETPPPDEKKERPKDAQDSLLDNLVDRTKDFAEDVPADEEGDPNGIAEGTAKVAKEGDLYRGKLFLFFQRTWQVPNVVQDVSSKRTQVNVSVADDGHVTRVELGKSSGDPLYDQSAIDAVQALIASGAVLPEPPVELRDQFYGTVIGVSFDGVNAR